MTPNERATTVYEALLPLLPFTHGAMTIETATADGAHLHLSGHGVPDFDPHTPDGSFEWVIANPPCGVRDADNDGQVDIDPIAALRAMIEDHLG